MPEPIAICIENCYPAHESLRYLRCVAISGAEKKLSFLPGGEVEWQQEAPGHGQIWVSADERLIFHRPAGSLGWAQVHRGGRSVDVPEGRPVVLLDQDYVVVPGFCFCVHIHGPAGQVHEPTYLDQAEPAKHTRTRFAAAGLMALSTLFGAGVACTTEKPVHEKPEPRQATDPDPVQPLPPKTEPNKKTTPIEPIDVRDHPPEPVDTESYRQLRPSEGRLSASVDTPALPPIEVRSAPPAPPPPMRPPMKGDMDAGVDDDEDEPPMKQPPMKQPPMKQPPASNPPAAGPKSQPLPPTAVAGPGSSPIEVRDAPPKPAPPPPPPPPMKGGMKSDMKGDMDAGVDDDETPPKP